MDIKAIRDLTRLMRDNDLVTLEVESQDLKVKLSKAGTAVMPAPAMPMPVAPAPAPAAAPAEEPVVDALAGCKEIVAPIPGTVYLKPNPDAASFIAVNDQVADGQVVCLIEAMKVFNEIKCEGMSGTIKKICVQDGQPVEFGTVLYLVA